MKFRFHRGGFKESMNTMREFSSISDLKIYIESVFPDPEYSNIRFEPYGYDSRENWGNTWLVMLTGRDGKEVPIGMSDARSFD